MPSKDLRNQQVTSPKGRPAAMPRGVWALGFVSLFMDISSEMIHSVLPVFLVSVLGASTSMLGFIEGVGEATASISKGFSGWLSDRLGKRKLLVALGYGLAALSKPLFAVAPTASWVLAARVVDRVGKGIRGAPRDALIGDLVPAGLRGTAYGLRQSLDTVGAVAGPLVALLLMEQFNNHFRLVMGLALIPGLIAVAVIVLAVREPPRAVAAENELAALRWNRQTRLGGVFWAVVIVGAILTLARFSEAFLILRAQGAGLPTALLPLVLIVMNVVYSASAYPVGAWSDRFGRKGLVGAGFGMLIVADLMLAFAPGVGVVMVGIAVWGLHMGMTQGLLAALVADAAPGELRGTAFGLFNLASGIMLLAASVIAGVLWDLVGPRATFISGAAIAAVGLLGAAAVTRRVTSSA